MKEKRAPKCIGIIMDGNRRWARKNGLPVAEGHRRGYQRFKEVSDWAIDAGVECTIVYALSTENWNRSDDEINNVLNLFRTVLKKDIEKLKRDKVRVCFIGNLSRFPEDIQKLMKKAEEETKENKNHRLVIAASYGGRDDITHAVNQLLKSGKDKVSEEDVSGALWTANIPEVDLIVRTGGERRLSNFLPWQATYAELFFSDTEWPDFSREEFDAILKEYGERERRHGR